MFIDHICCEPQCCVFVSATSTHLPLCLSATSFFQLDPVCDIDRASPTCARAPGLAAHAGPLSPSREVGGKTLFPTLANRGGQKTRPPKSIENRRNNGKTNWRNPLFWSQFLVLFWRCSFSFGPPFGAAYGCWLRSGPHVHGCVGIQTISGDLPW